MILPMMPNFVRVRPRDTYLPAHGSLRLVYRPHPRRPARFLPGAHPTGRLFRIPASSVSSRHALFVMEFPATLILLSFYYCAIVSLAFPHYFFGGSLRTPPCAGPSPRSLCDPQTALSPAREAAAAAAQGISRQTRVAGRAPRLDPQAGGRTSPRAAPGRRGLQLWRRGLQRSS